MWLPLWLTKRKFKLENNLFLIEIQNWHVFCRILLVEIQGQQWLLAFLQLSQTMKSRWVQLSMQAEPETLKTNLLLIEMQIQY